ncbi:MAG: RNA-binding protein [Chloroflexota bacterium]
MKELVEYIAKNLVSHPEDVRVDQSGVRVVRLRLRVHPDDMGRVIGREGRIAQAIRTLLRIAGARSGRRIELEIG